MASSYDLDLLLRAGAVHQSATASRSNLAALDVAFQAAVERNDADAMDQILHRDMVRVVGAGIIYARQQLLDSARNQDVIYERQVEDADTQVVRLFGEYTAVVTARLLIKGCYRESGKMIEREIWFSDTYVRTSEGWRYAFGQSSGGLQNPRELNQCPSQTESWRQSWHLGPG